MQPGIYDITILILIFIGLQAWWLVPIINRNNKMNERDKEIRKEINKLENLFKK